MGYSDSGHMLWPEYLIPGCRESIRSLNKLRQPINQTPGRGPACIHKNIQTFYQASTSVFFLKHDFIVGKKQIHYFYWFLYSYMFILQTKFCVDNEQREENKILIRKNYSIPSIITNKSQAFAFCYATLCLS